MPTAIHRGSGTKASGRGWLWAERLALSAGTIAIAVWIAAVTSGTLGARREIERFAAQQASATTSSANTPDLRLWSPERVRAWRETLTRESPVAMAVLRIRNLGLEVAVLEGTDDWTLNRAVGHIEDTALPGISGNIGIAGHRDGFFRGLKDIVEGDALDLETAGRTTHYRVDHVWIVKPEDVWVIDPTPSAAITLVTCYPFYFVGSAPQRYIVRAVPVTPQ